MRVPQSMVAGLVALALAVAACAPASLERHAVVESAGGEVAAPAFRQEPATAPVFRRIADSELPAASGETLWIGTYEGRTYGQHGALAIRLRGSGASPAGVVAWRATRPAGEALDRRSAGTERVTLVRASIVRSMRDGERVELALDDYFDPACGCTARATFRGVVRGDTLVGRFHVTGAATMVGEERGRFRAVRVQP